MRHLLIAASAIAVCGFLASTSVRAEPLFEPGGPVKIGNMCKVMTSVGGNESGYYEQCAAESTHYAKRGSKHQED